MSSDYSRGGGQYFIVLSLTKVTVSIIPCIEPINGSRPAHTCPCIVWCQTSTTASFNLERGG